MDLETIITNDFSLKFDNFDLSTIAYFHPVRRYPNVSPDISIKTAELIRRDGQIVQSRRFTKKVIPVECYIIAPSRQGYEETLDTVKFRVLNPTARPLSVIQSGVERYYTATCNSLEVEHIEGGNAKITLNFECDDPFGYDLDTVQEVIPDFTTATKAFDTVFNSNAPVSPTFTITVKAVSGGTGKTIQIGNSITAQIIGVTRNWVANDVLIVNTELKRVTVNGIPVDYTGIFPTFEPMSANAGYSDDFTTSRTIGAVIEYVRKYL